MENNEEVLLKVDHLCQYFKMGAGAELKAVDDVSFEVKKGEVFGLVGESGCGKTTTGRSVIKLYDITSGDVYFKGQRICAGTRSYENAIAAAKKEYAAEAKEIKGLIAADKKNGATEVRGEYAERLAAAKQKRDGIIAEQKELIASARNDHKNCEKIYMKKLAEEYDEAVQKAGSPENLSDEDKAKFRPIENLPKIKKRTWIISALAVFAVALAFLIASISLFAVFNGKYGDFETVSAVVDASDAQARTTTVHYEVSGKTYTKTLDYYNADLGVSTPEQLVRLRIYYNAENPAEVIVNKPSEPRAVAFLIVFFVLCAAGAGVLVYVNERYNPSRLVTRIQMIFQDPIASLNPRMTVKDIISEGLIINGEKDKKYIEQQVYKVLELVGLVPEHAGRYPHEFSGGQRQRRRAYFRFGRVYTGAGYQPVERTARQAGAYHTVYCARPVRRQVFFRPYRRYVLRQDGGACDVRRVVCAPVAPLHEVVAFRNTSARSRIRKNAQALRVQSACRTRLFAG